MRGNLTRYALPFASFTMFVVCESFHGGLKLMGFLFIFFFCFFSILEILSKVLLEE